MKQGECLKKRRSKCLLHKASGRTDRPPNGRSMVVNPMSSRPNNHQRKVMASWKATIIKNVDSLADLSAQTILKALQDGDTATAVFVFKLLYHRSTAWRKRLEFDDDPAQAQKEMEQAFTRGDLSTEELTVLIRSRDLQLKIAEHEALAGRLVALEAKLDQLLAQQKERTK